MDNKYNKMKLEKLSLFESQTISKEQSSKLFGGVFLTFPSGGTATGPGEACTSQMGIDGGGGDPSLGNCVSWTSDLQTGSGSITYYNVTAVNKPC
jgi:hypothetical protein